VLISYEAPYLDPERGRPTQAVRHAYINSIIMFGIALKQNFTT